MLESCVRTLATKHKCKRAAIYRQYYGPTSPGKKGLVVVAQDPHNGKTCQAEFGEVRFRAGQWPPRVADRNDQYVQTYRGTDLLKRLAADRCDLCGKQGKGIVYHIRGLRDMGEEKRKQGKALIKAEEFAIARQWKQVIVRPECHQQIHSGQYDGQAVKQPRRAGCAERCKSGSEGGSWKSACKGNSLAAYPTNVSGAAETREIRDGTKATTFSVAANTGHGDKQAPSMWHRVSSGGASIGTETVRKAKLCHRPGDPCCGAH